MEDWTGLFAKLKNVFTHEDEKKLGHPTTSQPIPLKAKKSNAKKTSPASVDKIDDFSKLLFLSDDKDGYVREKAIRKLGELGDPEAIPALIARTNDWVPEIRMTAVKAVRKLATPENAESFVWTLPEIYHLRKCKRANHHLFIDQIEQYLTSGSNVSEVINGLSSSDKSIAKVCFGLVTKYKLLAPSEFVLTGLKSKDISTRIKASHFLKDLEGEEKEKALNVAIKDKSVNVRREAFLILLSLWGNDTLAKKFLFDKHYAMREISIIHLRSLGLDVEYTYLRSLSEEKVSILCCALWGLGYLESKDCVAQIEPFLQHPDPAVQRQAKDTLDKLANVGHRKAMPDWKQTDTNYM